MTSQQISSIIRQVLAIVVSVYGVLSATLSALHLPVSVSTVLVAAGPVIFAIEHYVSDPSTGIPVRPAAVPGPQQVPQQVPSVPPVP